MQILSKARNSYFVWDENIPKTEQQNIILISLCDDIEGQYTGRSIKGVPDLKIFRVRRYV